MLLPDLPDAALLTIRTCDPALPAAAAKALCQGIARLFEQFVREGRCQRGGAAIDAGGAVLLIAWEGPALSGCSHDKIHGVLSIHEQRSGIRLLDAPPFLVAPAGVARAVDRAGLRRLVADGALNADDPAWDLSATTLGAWRSAGATTCRRHTLIQRLIAWV